MDHRKAETIAYRNRIHSFQSFGQLEAQKFSFIQPLFHPETEFISEVDVQNSVTSKPFVGWGWISNWWKAGRFAHLFAIHL
jgi:hypothetical protein